MLKHIVPQYVEAHITKEGRVPFSQWLDSLKEQKAIEKIEVRINRLRLGNLGNYKFVGNGVFELKIDYGPGYRIYFGQTGSKIILLNGGTKSTQQKDIQKAQNYWLEAKKI